ncbi:hypothetical protein ACQPYK_20295 [Streptosporangium sp. CA-135522]
MIRLYAGLLGIGQRPDRDLRTVLRAVGTAARRGNLCGGLIEAVLIGT